MTGKVTIEAKVLGDAMKHAAAIIEGRNTVPILANVRLIARDGRLEVLTSDLDVEFRQVLPLREDGALATTVDARRFAALVASVEDGAQIGLESDPTAGGRLVVRSGRSRWAIPALPAEDFPQLPFDEKGLPIRIVGAALAKAIARVEWAVSTNPAKPYISGPLLHGEDGEAQLVGCDGNLLVRTPLGVNYPNGAPEVILGPKYIRTLQRLLADREEEIELVWDEAKVRARIGGEPPHTVLTGKVIDAVYPDYRRILPAKSDAPLVFEPAPLRAAIRRVMLVASEKTRLVEFVRGEGKLTLSATTPEMGEASEELPADGAEAPATAFNGQYLDRIVEAIGGETIEMGMPDPSTNPPTGARFERAASDGAVALLMPMRIKGG